MAESRKEQSLSMFEIAKRLFFILIFFYFARPLLEGIAKQYGSYFKTHSKVGLLKLHGALYDSAYHVKYLNLFFEDDSIKAILLKIECPGSASATGQTIHDELRALKLKHPNKTVIALVENVCTSGGYLIASATDYIIAPGMSLIGSIGVYMPYLFQLNEFIDQYKIHYTQVKAGKYKTIGDPFAQMTPDEQEMLQGVLNDSYEQFVQDVSRNRNLPLAQASSWADGKLFSGRQALKLGLIDELGSAYTAEKILRDRGVIEGEIQWVNPPQPSKLASWFGEDQESLLTGFLNQVCTFFEQRYSAGKTN